MPTTQIKDPVHGYVELEQPLVDSILDTRPFQRLRHVRQLSATNLVYPGANHTRFEHSWASTTSRAPSSRTSASNSTSTRTPRARNSTTSSAPWSARRSSTTSATRRSPHLGERFLDVDDLRTRLADHGLQETFFDAGVGDAPIREASAHELLGCLLVCREYGDALGEMGVDPHDVCAHVLGYSLEYERGGRWQHTASPPRCCTRPSTSTASTTSRGTTR